MLRLAQVQLPVQRRRVPLLVLQRARRLAPSRAKLYLAPLVRRRLLHRPPPPKRLRVAATAAAAAAAAASGRGGGGAQREVCAGSELGQVLDQGLVGTHRRGELRLELAHLLVQRRLLAPPRRRGRAQAVRQAPGLATGRPRPRRLQAQLILEA